MNQEEALQKALEALQQYVWKLAQKAGESEEYAAELWKKIARSNGILREFAYFHDTGDFLGEYKVAGYGSTDILVWQVDHFKAYLDRPEEMNRYHREKLLLTAFEILCNMEENPQVYVEKLRGESGTDFVDKF